MCIYTQTYLNGILAIKKNEIPLAAGWIDLEIIILSEVSQRETLYNTIYMWTLKSDTNELIQNRNRVTDIEIKFMVIKVERMRGRINCEFGIYRYT